MNNVVNIGVGFAAVKRNDQQQHHHGTTLVSEQDDSNGSNRQLQAAQNKTTFTFRRTADTTTDIHQRMCKNSQINTKKRKRKYANQLAY